MKPFFTILLIALSNSVIQSSCKKHYTTDATPKEKPPISLDSMLQCHGQNNWDSARIRNALIGNWQWEYITCYWTPENANGKDYKNLTLEFMQNDSVAVKSNNAALILENNPIKRCLFKTNS